MGGPLLIENQLDWLIQLVNRQHRAGGDLDAVDGGRASRVLGGVVPLMLGHLELEVVGLALALLLRGLDGELETRKSLADERGLFSHALRP
jgi:hypothetical protein